MNINRRFVAFATQALHPRCWLAAAKRKAVRVEVLAIGMLLMPVILVMADHLPFVDVPSNAFFHNAVSAVYGARITTGTSPTTFSPEDLVTRGQMAVFLHRGLGRVAYKKGSDLPILYEPRELALLRINTGGAAGGTGFLKVDATFTATTDEYCPCRIQFYLSADGGPTSQVQYLTLYPHTSFVTSSASGAATLAFPLPTGNLPQNVRLFARIVESAGPFPAIIHGGGSISAIWVPFGDTGGSVLNAASASPDDVPQGTQPDAKPDTER